MMTEDKDVLGAEDWTGGPIHSEQYRSVNGWLHNGFEEMEEELFDNPDVMNLRWYHGGPKEIKNDLIDIRSLIENHGYGGFEFSPKTLAEVDELDRLLKNNFANVTHVTNKRVTFDSFRAWLTERRREDADV